MKFRHFVTATSIFCACFAVSSFAADTPATLTGVKTASAEQAKQAIASGAKVYDVRVVVEYNEEHIKGAVSVPYKEKSKKEVSFDASQDNFDVAALGANKAAPIVLYCNGAECWKSYKSAVHAVKAGYKNILWLRGGLPEWKAKGFPTEK